MNGGVRLVRPAGSSSAWTTTRYWQRTAASHHRFGDYQCPSPGFCKETLPRSARIIDTGRVSSCSALPAARALDGVTGARATDARRIRGVREFHDNSPDGPRAPKAKLPISASTTSNGWPPHQARYAASMSARLGKYSRSAADYAPAAVVGLRGHAVFFIKTRPCSAPQPFSTFQKTSKKAEEVGRFRALRQAMASQHCRGTS